LLKKKAGKYRLYDYTERGDENALGQQTEDGNAAPVIDVLHRLLWLMEHKPLKIPEFLNEAAPNVEQIRLVAQALVGPALSGGELADVSSTAEQSALGKLLANWSTVMVGKVALEDRRTGQQPLFKN
jgi:putative DNA methylase